MALRKCLTCGQLQSEGSRHKSCQKRVDAQRYAKPERVARKQQRYDSSYRSERSRWADLIRSGVPVPCCFCGTNVGLRFDLDHRPDGTLRPAHPACNRSDGAKRKR